ncbi:MAG: hypothetical protein WCV99_20075 [Sterolibacterium sp.]
MSVSSMKGFFVKKFLLAIAILTNLSCACAQDTFNTSTNVLSIPAVTIGQTLYSNVQLRLDSFAVVDAGSSNPVPKPCTASNFTAAKVNAIDIGMTLTQVKEIIGCDNYEVYASQLGYSNQIYSWSYRSYVPQYTSSVILVFFDAEGQGVTPLQGTTVIKMSSGF